MVCARAGQACRRSLRGPGVALGFGHLVNRQCGYRVVPSAGIVHGEDNRTTCVASFETIRIASDTAAASCSVNPLPASGFQTGPV